MTVRHPPHREPRRRTRRRPLQRRVSRLLSMLLSSLFASLAAAQILPPPPTALPTGGLVVVGSGRISSQGAAMTIDQSSTRLGIDWQRFDIGSAASVDFRQPSASSIALNRIVGNDASQIYGRLSANGQVFLANPNGVLFAPGAKVDVGGLVASTLDLSQQDFADGRLEFRDVGGAGRVVNQGRLSAADGGYLALFGRQVANEGELTVRGGSVMLASGRAATVSISGGGLLSAVVAPGMSGSVANRGLIDAAGSAVTMTARSAEALASSLVNNSGVVRANSIVERNGEIWITGDDVANSGTLAADGVGALAGGRIVVKGDAARGSASIGGTLSARGGGAIETSAAHLRVEAGTRVSTMGGNGRAGTWTIDPTDFTVSAGGAAQTTSGIGADTLSTNLGSTSVALVTDSGGSEPGDIKVNAAVSWSANTTLTLTAAHDVAVNASITATGDTAGLVLTPGAGGAFKLASGSKVTLSGATPTLSIGGSGYTVVNDLTALQSINASNGNLAGRWALGSDIDASASASMNAGAGFMPIGGVSTGTPFSGSFDGLGHGVAGLTVDRPSATYAGLFGYTNNATLRNVAITGGAITGGANVGALVGLANGTTTIASATASATITGPNGAGDVGGLVGQFSGSALTGASASGSVSGGNATGGLVGNFSSNASLSGAHASGNVSGTGSAGGLIGYASGTGSLASSDASGTVATTATTSSAGTGSAGGLVGYASFSGGMTGVSASGSVSGGYYSGGLVGYLNAGALDSASSTAATVDGGTWVGGLVGYAGSTGAISHATASATVTSAGNAGGLAGLTNGAVSDSSASGNVTGAAGGDVGGLVGRAGGSGAFTNVSATGDVAGTSGSGRVGGLVGYMTSGAITTATASGDVSGGQYTGGLVGQYNVNAAVSGATATGSTVSGGQYAGGLFGGSGASSVSSSSASADVSGGSNGGGVGGLVGYAYNSGSFTDVVATGTVGSATTNASVGGLIGIDDAGGVLRGSASGAVSGGQYTGGLVGYYSNAGNIDSSHATGNVSGGGSVGGLIGFASGSGSLSASDASGTVTTTATTSSSSTGSAGGLAGYAGLSGGLSNVSSSGAVSGGYYTGGLVGYFASGSMDHASSTAATVTGGTYAGGLIGYGASGGSISNATAVANVTGTGDAGGLAGATNGAVSSSSASGKVTGANGGDVGGLVGQANGTGAFSDVSASGLVTGTTGSGRVGGLVGYMTSGSLTNASASGNVSGGQYTGGLIGHFGSNSAISHANSTATSVSGGTYTGGLIGLSSSTSITDVSAVANVVGADDVGGLIGQANATVTLTDASAHGNVSGTGNVGGLAGILYYGGTITNGQATGSVSAVGDSVSAGGLIGTYGYYYYSNCSSCSLSSSSATGNVFADGYTAYVGGLVGLQYGNTISGSFATGRVTGQDSTNSSYGSHYTGGLVGYITSYYTDASIANSYATGDVVGRYYTGGLAGYFSGGSISGSSASGKVTGQQYAGGLVGQFSGTSISDSNASGAVSGTSRVGGLVGQAYLSANASNLSATGDVSAGSSAYAAGGLFGSLSGGGITNGFASGKVSAASTSYAGGLVGVFSPSISGATINDSAATGSVTGNYYVGGLVGDVNNYGSYGGVTNSHATGDVSGVYYAGGLVGYYYGYTGSGGSSNDIANSYATGNVTGASYAGGLVGLFQGAQGIASSFATGNVSFNGSHTDAYLGGLVGSYTSYGSTANAPIRSSYATGSVTLGPSAALDYYDDVYAGGLVGYLSYAYSSYKNALHDAYSTGAVSVSNAGGRFYVGGLVGYAYANIDRAYSSGAVVASGGSYAAQVGGLVGAKYSSSTTVTNAYWDTEASGQASSAGGIGLTSAQMLQSSSFGGFDIATTGSAGKTWRIYEGFTAPLLTGSTEGFLTELGLTLADASKVYDGNKSFGNATLSTGSGNVSHPERIFTSASSADVGSYTVGASGVYSVQSGYDLTVTGSATLTITPRPLSIDGIVADKVYDGTRTATLVDHAQPTGLVAGEDLNINASGVAAVFDTKDVARSGGDIAAKTVTVTGLTLSDGTHGKASNYSLSNATTTTARITPAPLVAGGFAATDRVYDGSTTVAVTATPNGSVTGRFGSDDVNVDLSSVTSGTMADKNVGTAKPVTVLGATLSGADAGDYVIAGIDGVTVNITPKTLAVNGLTASNRTYNASTDVSVNTANATVSGALGGDSVVLRNTTVTGTMADKNVGSAKAVTVTGLTLRGADAANYTAQAGTTTVDISPYALSLYAYRNSQTDKVYDGTTAANVTVAWYYGPYYGDSVSFTTNPAAYSDKNVAYNGSGQVTSKTITVDGFQIHGADVDAGNYTLSNASYTVSGTISPRSLKVTGVAASNRTYDGTVNVVVDVGSASVDTSSVVAGDNVGVSVPGSGSVTGTMADKNVGTGKAVTVPGFSLTGADKGNYTLSGSNGVTVDITKKDLNATYVGVDKVYDGSTTAQVSASSADIVSGDSVGFATNNSYYYSCWYYGGCAVFTGTGAKNVGTNKSISVTSDYLTGTDAGNYNFVNAGKGTATASITAKAITPYFNGVNKVYDGTDAASVTLATCSGGLVCGDSVSSTQTAVFTGTGAKNVGTGKPIAVSGVVLTGTDAANYTLSTTTGSASADVTAKPVTLSGISATSRAYDGTTTVAVSAGSVGSSGFVSGDDVAVQQPAGGLTSGTLADKNVGVAKPVTVTGLSLSGADAANYSIDLAGSGITVDITPKSLTASYAGVSRAYNGGVTANVVGSSTDIVSGDTVTFSQSAVYTGADARYVGTGKPISITGITLGGSDAANYALQNATAATSADITPKPITVVYTGVDRVYDGVGDRSIGVVGRSTGIVAGDNVGFTQTAVLHGDGSAGNAKPVDVSAIKPVGLQSDNYVVTSTTATTTANVTPKPIGVTGITATNRVYDGTATVAINTTNAHIDTSAVIGGDSVVANLPPDGISTGTVVVNGVPDKNVGNNKTVQVTGLSLSGSSAANYQLIGAAGLTVNITPAALTATYAGVDKVYDGSLVAQVVASAQGVLAGDLGAIGISAPATFADRNVAYDGGGQVTGKTITVTGAFLTGVERNNYTLSNPGGTATASITPKSLAPSYAGGTRVYDGTTAAPVTSTTAGIVANDDVGFTQTAVFTGSGAKNVGSGKPVDVSGIALTGHDKGNYQLQSTTAATTGSVTPKGITVAGLTDVSASDRVYDGTRTVQVNIPSGAVLQPNSADIVSGDDVTIAVPPAGATTGTMADKNVGRNKAVAITGLDLSGADAANYYVAGAQGVTVDITPLSLTASYAGVSRIYDGTVAVAVGGSLPGAIAGDLVSVTASGTFTGSGAKNVGTAKPVQVSNGSLGGGDAGNYTLGNPTGTTTADVTPRTLTAGYVGGTRVYDGTTAAPVTASLSGYVPGDDVSVSQTAVFTGAGAKNVGSGKSVQVSAIAIGGGDAANYVLSNGSATTTASITPRPVTIDGLTGIAATDRVYDGTTSVAVTVSGNGTPIPHPGDIIAGDNVTLSLPNLGNTTGTMADKNVGTGKAVVVDGLALSGPDAANYRIVGADGVTVNITPKTIHASYAGVDKVYDGTANALVVGSSLDLVAGDVVTITASGLFTGSGAKNVGTGKAIAFSDAVFAGADAGNYVLDNPGGSATASITPRTINPLYTGGTRVYDGTVAAPVSVVADLVAGDSVSLSQTAVFTGSGAKNVGTGKPVEISNIALSGDDASNYALAIQSASTTATVTKRPVTITGITGVKAQDRVYDGTRTVQVTVSDSGPVTPSSADLIAGDDVSIGGQINGQTSGQMADKNVGTGKAVVVSGLTLAGADAGNYEIAGIGGVTVNITPLALQAGGLKAVDRVYDGTTAVAIDTSGGLLSGGVIGGDSVFLATSGVSGQMADKNAGTGKAVTLGGNVGLSGADAGNYTLASTGTLSVNIAPRPLNVTATVATRVYDGTTHAPLVFGSDAIDTLTIGADASYASAGAGTGKPVTVGALSVAGSDAGNYTLVTTPSSFALTGTITPAPLVVTAKDGLSKTYGEALVFTGSEFKASGLVGTETFTSATLASAGADAAAHAGTSPVGVSGISGAANGFDPQNYAVSYVDGTLTIVPRKVGVAPITQLVLQTAQGETPPTLNLGVSTSPGGLVGSDALTATVTPVNFDPYTVGVYLLSPGNVQFTHGEAADYEVGLANAAVFVAPTPPKIGDAVAAAAGNGNGGNTVFVVELPKERVDAAFAALDNAAAVVNQPPGERRREPRPAAATGMPVASIVVDTGEGPRRVSLSDLLRAPLISLDPQMRRLITGHE